MHTHTHNEAITPKNPTYAAHLRDFFCIQTKYDAVESDITTEAVVADMFTQAEAHIIAKEKGIIAGTEEIEWLCKESYIPLSCMWNVSDGNTIEKGKEIMRITGSAADIMKYERFILNVLQRMSGIATYTAEMVKNLDKNILLCATRKTLWGMIDKKAVSIGGGGTHRLSLADAVLVKENHISLAQKPFKDIVRDAFASKKGRFIEIEVENKEQVEAFCEVYSKYAPEIPVTIMLDNFSEADAKAAIEYIRGKCDVQIEISGGITKKNLAEYAALSPDIISMGALTNAPHSLDMSLRMC